MMRVPIDPAHVKKEWNAFRYFPNPEDRRLGTTHLMTKRVVHFPLPPNLEYAHDDPFVKLPDMTERITSYDIFFCEALGCDNWASLAELTDDQTRAIVRMLPDFKAR